MSDNAKEKRTGLGKGFDILMPQGVENALLEKGTRVQNLFISDIAPNPDQPRRTFESSSLEELSESIKNYGVLQPLIVTPKGNKYQIISGERRWRASKLAGLKEVPVITRTAKELEQLEIAMVENIQRVDLSPLEQAASISKLHEIFGVSFSEIAKRLGKAEPTISNTLRLLQLPPSAQDALMDNRISEGHARSILALKQFPQQQEELLILIQKNGWSVRQAESFVVATKSGQKTSEKAKKRTAAHTPETERLTKVLKYPVSVNHMAQGGRLIIRFKSDDEYSALVDLLSKIKDKN